MLLAILFSLLFSFSCEKGKVEVAIKSTIMNTQDSLTLVEKGKIYFSEKSKSGLIIEGVFLGEEDESDIGSTFVLVRDKERKVKWYKNISSEQSFTFNSRMLLIYKSSEFGFDPNSSIMIFDINDGKMLRIIKSFYKDGMALNEIIMTDKIAFLSYTNPTSELVGLRKYDLNINNFSEINLKEKGYFTIQSDHTNTFVFLLDAEKKIVRFLTDKPVGMMKYKNHKGQLIEEAVK